MEIDLKRKLGALLEEMPRGGPPDRDAMSAPTDIARQRRSDLRALAAVPEAVVEAEKRKAEAEGRRLIRRSAGLCEVLIPN